MSVVGFIGRSLVRRCPRSVCLLRPISTGTRPGHTHIAGRCWYFAVARGTYFWHMRKIAVTRLFLLPRGPHSPHLHAHFCAYVRRGHTQKRGLASPGRDSCPVLGSLGLKYSVTENWLVLMLRPRRSVYSVGTTLRKYLRSHVWPQGAKPSWSASLQHATSDRSGFLSFRCA